MDPIEQLNLFCHEAGQLRQEPLVRTGWDNSFTLNYNHTRGVSLALLQPNETLLRSLLLALRRFVSLKEPVFLDRIYNLCVRHITSDSLRRLVEDARTKWKQAQRSAGMKFVVNGRELTPAQIADLWINGHYFHSSDAEKRRQLRLISPFAIDRFAFVGFVGDTLRHTLYLDNVIRHALRDGYISSSPAA